MPETPEGAGDNLDQSAELPEYQTQPKTENDTDKGGKAMQTSTDKTRPSKQ